MSGENWTPGPWEYRKGEVRSTREPIVVAEPTDLSLYQKRWEQAEEEANGHLIAAAPDMYEALERLAHVTNRPDLTEYDEAMEALAKARGEETP